MKKIEKKKFDYKWVIIILLLIIVIILLLTRCSGTFDGQPLETVIEAAPQEENEYIPLEAKQVRIRINTELDIENGRVRDLEFINYNEGKLMSLTLTVDDETIYESSMISTGESITDANVDVSKLKRGKNEGLAEVKYYMEDGTYDGETHFNVNINY